MIHDNIKDQICDNNKRDEVASMQMEFLQLQQYLNVHPIIKKNDSLKKRYVALINYFIEKQSGSDLWGKQTYKLYCDKIVGQEKNIEKTKEKDLSIFERLKFSKYRYFLLTDCLFIACFKDKKKGQEILDSMVEFYGEKYRKKLERFYQAFYSAEGEYKHVFGNRPDVKVFGTNPEYSDLLRINPFKFPKGVHVLEHVDRLVEIFNVCWPMYAAMPAVLKDALLQSYEVCGWDFSTSRNAYGDNLYPTFSDLQNEMVNVINSSAYSEEVKSNYMGSLVTRVKSLTNGLNGQIFCSNEIDNELLFDKNVIIDLSRIGSLETKSLIMGILIMRLSEHRMTNAEDTNVSLKHLTVLEEAHNILKRTSTEQSTEGSNVTGKSVEMISNAIAEMRTYGEGFVIVDQSPTAVDISAIRNTNTKIIMRLPDESDRRLAGKSAGLKDEQLDEIAKLPKGVAVVYQNDWVEPLLCSIQKYKGTEGRYQYEPSNRVSSTTGKLRKKLLQLLLKNRVKNPIDSNIDEIFTLLEHAEISTRSRLGLQRVLQEYKLRNDLSLWKEDNFDSLSELVSGLLDGNTWVKPIIDQVGEFDELTDSIIKQVEKMAPGINNDYALAATQCLMKKESVESDGYNEIYAAWITQLRNKGVM